MGDTFSIYCDESGRLKNYAAFFNQHQFEEIRIV